MEILEIEFFKLHFNTKSDVKPTDVDSNCIFQYKFSERVFFAAQERRTNVGYNSTAFTNIICGVA